MDTEQLMTFADGMKPFPKYTIDEISAFARDAAEVGARNAAFDAWCAGYMTLARQIADGTHRVECTYGEDGHRKRVYVEPVGSDPIGEMFEIADQPRIPEALSDQMQRCADRAHQQEQERLLREAQELVDAGVRLADLRQVQVGMFGAAKIVTRQALEAIERCSKEHTKEGA